MDLIEIKGRIEKLRSELNDIIGCCHELTDQTVVIKSELLDDALNQFYMLINANRTDVRSEKPAI